MSTATRSRRGHTEEHEEENSERWLVTYADVLTLLMVLFIVLYAISQVDSKKFHQLSSSLASAFNGGDQSVFEGNDGLQDDAGADIAPQLSKADVTTGVTQDLPASADAAAAAQAQAQAAQAAQAKAAATGGAPGEADGSGAQPDVQDAAQFAALGKQLTDALAAAGLPGAATTSVTARGLVVSVVTSDVVFGGNSAELRPGGAQVLDALAPTLAGVGNSLEVDGHTNQQQVSTAPYASGWELSSSRASAVVRYLISKGLPAGRLSAVGWSDQRPLYPADDPRSITLNRRVDIVVLAQ